MLAQERHVVIMEMLKEQNIIKISDIAKRFGVSNLTARRDLDVLQDQNLVRRVYGGAVLCQEGAPEELAAAVKKEVDPHGTLRRARRAAIADAAVKMVRDGDRVHLGNGITVEEVARRLRRFQRLSIVTGSLGAVNQLMNSGHEVYVLGGLLQHDERNLTGSYAIDMAKDFHVNIAFMPCAGVSAEYGVMSDYLPATVLGRVGIENAQKAVLLCGSKKIGRTAFHTVCPVSALDAIITDDGITQEQKESLEACGVQVIVVSPKLEDAAEA